MMDDGHSNWSPNLMTSRKEQSPIKTIPSIVTQSNDKRQPQRITRQTTDEAGERPIDFAGDQTYNEIVFADVLHWIEARSA